jgi:hypothetical protein
LPAEAADGEVVVAVPEPVELVEVVAPAGLPVAGRGPVVAPGLTVGSRDQAVPQASTVAQPDRLAVGAAVLPVGWVVPLWQVQWRDLVVLEPLALTVLEGLAQRV